MRNRFLVSMVGLMGAALVFPATLSTQNSSTQTWPQPVPNRCAASCEWQAIRPARGSRPR